jgi:hypothetical protein
MTPEIIHISWLNSFTILITTILSLRCQLFVTSILLYVFNTHYLLTFFFNDFTDSSSCNMYYFMGISSSSEANKSNVCSSSLMLSYVFISLNVNSLNLLIWLNKLSLSSIFSEYKLIFIDNRLVNVVDANMD